MFFQEPKKVEKRKLRIGSLNFLLLIEEHLMLNLLQKVEQNFAPKKFF